MYICAATCISVLSILWVARNSVLWIPVCFARSVQALVTMPVHRGHAVLPDQRSAQKRAQTNLLLDDVVWWRCMRGKGYSAPRSLPILIKSIHCARSRIGPVVLAKEIHYHINCHGIMFRVVERLNQAVLPG